MPLDRRLRDEFERTAAAASSTVDPEAMTTVVDRVGHIRRNRRVALAGSALAVLIIVALVSVPHLAGARGSVPPGTTPAPSPNRSPLTQSFTSTQHGYAIDLPAGWTAVAAGDPSQADAFRSPSGAALSVTSRAARTRADRRPVGEPTTSPPPEAPDDATASRRATSGCRSSSVGSRAGSSAATSGAISRRRSSSLMTGCTSSMPSPSCPLACSTRDCSNRCWRASGSRRRPARRTRAGAEARLGGVPLVRAGSARDSGAITPRRRPGAVESHREGRSLDADRRRAGRAGGAA